jgi:multiple sugar transport system ATP-binding protein
MGTVELRNLSKVFDSGDGEIVAVDDLNIPLEDGEFLVLVGPSGCGKSTTLRMIAGLETTTHGDILIDDDSVEEKEPRDRDIAMVFQNYALYPHMTARENMSFGLKMNSTLSKDEIRERVEEVAAMMGIEDLLEDEPRELSGGQQQRVALGRAIVRDPAVFLMDEPLSNLDAKLRTQMRTELQALQDDLGTTTIYVTHDQTEAMTMGDRIAILNDGTLQQVGTPLECYNRPANRFVAGFIGSPSMNFLDVTLTDNTLIHPEFEYTVSDETVAAVDNRSDLVLGARPEDIELTNESDTNVIKAAAQVVEPLGDFSHLHATIGQDQLTVTVDTETRIPRNGSLHLSISEERLHLFDRDTGDALKNSNAPIEEEQLMTV